MTETLYLLICEGSCNPSIDSVDEGIRRASRGAKIPCPIGTEYLWERQRQLKHTPHRELGGHFCQCTICQRTRRYGS